MGLLSAQLSSPPKSRVVLNTAAVFRPTLLSGVFHAPLVPPRPERALRQESTTSGTPLPYPTLRPLPRDPELSIDNVNLGNPLKRAERLGTSWLGVIVDLEGVLVDYDTTLVSDLSWQRLAAEEGRMPLPVWALRKAENMKNEQVVQEVFEWAWNRKEVARLSRRREELLAETLADVPVVVSPEMLSTLRMLHENHIPVSVVSSGPQSRATLLLSSALAADGALGPVITSEDVLRGLPDPTAYLSAAAAIGRPATRCAVLCASNLSIEAAHEGGMKAVAVAARRPMYELGAADTVARNVGSLSFMDFKRLFAEEETAARLEDLAFDATCAQECSA